MLPHIYIILLELERGICGIWRHDVHTKFHKVRQMDYSRRTDGSVVDPYERGKERSDSTKGG
jgi:hypothetical protein